jgi:segregation and condensation protein B
VMRTLTLRGLVEEAGTEHETGAILYRTTSYFLERLGLASLADLPELAPFLPDQIEDTENGSEPGPGGDLASSGGAADPGDEPAGR